MSVSATSAEEQIRWKGITYMPGVIEENPRPGAVGCICAVTIILALETQFIKITSLTSS